MEKANGGVNNECSEVYQCVWVTAI